MSRLFSRRCFVFRNLRRQQYLSVPIVFIRFLFAKLWDETMARYPRGSDREIIRPHKANELIEKCGAGKTVGHPP